MTSIWSSLIWRRSGLVAALRPVILGIIIFVCVGLNPEEPAPDDFFCDNCAKI